jgi:hypothetical protein
VNEPPTTAGSSGNFAVVGSSRYFTRVLNSRICALSVLLAGAASAEAPAQCVVVRKPTAQQREASAVDVERLLDAYETKTNDSAAWPIALAEVFDRFPLPSVNMLMALHHPLWSAPEQKLLAYVEATRQDPGDYAEPAAVAQTITRVKQTLLPEVQRWPLLIIEARGITLRREIDKLDVRIDDQACAGNSISVDKAYSVSWVDQGQRIFATFTPQQLADRGDWCIAIEHATIGSCGGEPNPVQPPSAATAAPNRAPPSPQRYAPISLSHSNPTLPSPSMDYRLAVPGLALAIVGFGIAAYARYEVDVRMDRAEGGPDPTCQDGQCSQSGMADVLSARNWNTVYYAAGAAGLLGLGALIASGHRYYTHWLFPASKHTDQEARFRSLNLVPSVAVHGAGLSFQSRLYSW